MNNLVGFVSFDRPSLSSAEHCSYRILFYRIPYGVFC